MIIRLDDYRKKKKKKTNSYSMISIPVFSRITVEDGKLIGVLQNGQKIIIENSEEKR
ncbi:hypothetical protein H1215_15655 [Anoxybacillus sp. LAT_38]|uniref:hypothetical protein n=1 Tax=Anoxybacillus sp. LAT_26 TaxID=2862719 RepID=UPI001EEC44E8|nr:hypothetical protein [Anoxybacillus sp. LAT_26]MCG6184286.1 hypothetical protein [Anoxybacillus sp. LAT_26]MCG6198609.1 hypothetical protein [Anoxybacillus sp. LAT_38]